jgi:hypothetical protein
VNIYGQAASPVGGHRAWSARANRISSLICVVVLAGAACGAAAASPPRAEVEPQSAQSAHRATPTRTPDLPTSGIAPASATSIPIAELAASAYPTTPDHHERVGTSEAHAVFLHGLHAPFGIALPMSRIPAH